MALNGVGLGLRRELAAQLLEASAADAATWPDWLEITPENWLRYGGARRRTLDRCLERWPAVSHSVSLNLGGPDPLDPSLLAALREFARRTAPPFFSDHICYSSLGGAQLNDLLPLPFTEEAADRVAARAGQAQEAVGVPLILENATFYAHMPGGTMDEATFLREVLLRSGCDLLLDVNNVYVNSLNHGGSPRAVIDALPLERVREIHLAGHTHTGDLVIDTHIGPIIDEVWDLYRYTLARAGRRIPTLIEWDQDIPPLPALLAEVGRARQQAEIAVPA